MLANEIGHSYASYARKLSLYYFAARFTDLNFITLVLIGHSRRVYVHSRGLTVETFPRFRSRSRYRLRYNSLSLYLLLSLNH